MYIGHTKDIEDRLKEHNRGKVKATRHLFHSKHFILKISTRLEAISREKELKGSQGRRFLRKLLSSKSGEAQTS
jgi:putative endonuclease